MKLRPIVAPHDAPAGDQLAFFDTAVPYSVLVAEDVRRGDRLRVFDGWLYLLVPRVHRLVRIDWPGKESRRAWCSCGARGRTFGIDPYDARDRALRWHLGHRRFPTETAAGVATLLTR